jgi:endo-1,4-beta-D-glucanase Y
LITYLTKLHNESKLFSFQNSYAQKQIIKLHKFLAANLKSYSTEFPVDNYEVKNTNAVTGEGASEKLIPSKVIAVKGHIDKLKDEYSFMYVLGKIDQTQAKTKSGLFQNEADLTAILHNSDRPLYGYVI